jgi:hypothetical protein
MRKAYKYGPKITSLKEILGELTVDGTIILI